MNHIFRRQLFLELGNFLGWPRNHAKRGPIYRRERQILRQPLACIGFAQSNRQHRAMRKRLHQTSARGDQPQSIFEGEDACQARRNKFADAMPDHKVRLNAPAHPQLRQRIFDRENRRLRQDGLRHLVPQIVRDCFGRIE